MKKRSFSIINLFLFIVLTFYSVLLLWMLGWAFLSSVKTLGDYTINPLSFPKQWKFDNYVKAFEVIQVPVMTSEGRRVIGLLEMFGYSLLYSVGASILGAIMPCIAAYLTAKYKSWFNNIAYAIVVFTMIIPIIGNLPSMLQVLDFLGLYNTIYGVWIMKASFLGMYFLVFYGTFKSVSWEYAEAAIIDGAGHFRIMFNIMMPLIKNTIVTVFILLFIANWNDYQTPMIYMPDMPTAAYGLHKFIKQNGGHGSNQIPPIQLAAGMVILLPILTIFLILKDTIMNNISMGGLKG